DFSTIPIDYVKAKDPNTIDFCLSYLELYHTTKAVKACTPFSFILGSDAGMQRATETTESLYWGKVILDINPNLSPLVNTTIVLEIESMLSSNSINRSENKRITRYIEKENFVNESSERFEFFKSMELSHLSTAYDVYVTFIGFKIDL
nr:Chain E, Penton protein P12 [Flavobacterium phage FLiP]